MKKIKSNISQDINDEFNKIRDDLKIHLHEDYEILQTKEFLSSHIPKEILSKSDILL